MRLYKYLFFLGLLAFGACQSEAPVPDDIISMEKMPYICAEMHIIDGNLYNISQVPDTLYKYSMGHYLVIFKKYGTDTTQFKKSFTWYTRNPVKLDHIYDDVLKVLQAKNDSLVKSRTPATPAKTPNAVPAK